MKREARGRGGDCETWRDRDAVEYSTSPLFSDREREELDGVPLIPGWIRVAWLILSLQGFKKQIGWVPWDALRAVHVDGLPMMRWLTIDATIVYPTFLGTGIAAQIGDGIAFRDAAFREPLDAIASAISAFYENPAARIALPS